MARRVMSYEEAKRFVLATLADGRRRTTQDVDAASSRANKRCPDSTAKFLARLRLEGLVHGELDYRTGTWRWWVDGAGS